MRYIEERVEVAERYTSLSTSFAVVLIIWSVGATVFWKLERNHTEGWSFPRSLYCSFTSLTTIGYGDYYPTTNASRPFFVIWSLISVPAMTVFLSNMGDTVLDMVQFLTEWAFHKTFLLSDDEEVEEEKRFLGFRSNKKKSGTTPGTERTVRFLPHQTRPPSQNLRRRHGHHFPHHLLPPHIHPPQVHLAHHPPSPRPPSLAFIHSSLIYHATLNRFASSRIQAEEMIESEPLSIVVSYAIAVVSRYTNSKEKGGKRWTWDEWMVWLRILGVRKPWEEGHDEDEVSTSGGGEGEGKEKEKEVKKRTRARWTWLSDHGPLLSSKNESEWLLERLCRRLDEVLRMNEYEDRDKAEDVGEEEGIVDDGEEDVDQV